MTGLTQFLDNQYVQISQARVTLTYDNSSWLWCGYNPGMTIVWGVATVLSGKNDIDEVIIAI